MPVLYVALVSRDPMKDPSLTIKVSHAAKRENLGDSEETQRRDYGITTLDLLGRTEELNFRTYKTLDTEELFLAKSLAKHGENKGMIHVVITTPDYPFVLAVECIDYLSQCNVCRKRNPFQSDVAYEREFLKWCVHVGSTYSNVEPGCFLYELLNMMENPRNEGAVDQISAYQDQVLRYLERRQDMERARRLRGAVAEVQQQMAEVFDEHLQNLVDAESLVNMTDEAMKNAKVFRKEAAKLLEVTARRKSSLTMAVVSAVTVGTVNLLTFYSTIDFLTAVALYFYLGYRYGNEAVSRGFGNRRKSFFNVIGTNVPRNPILLF